jgi:hypothetical protein
MMDSELTPTKNLSTMVPDMKNQTRSYILGGLLQFNTSAGHGQQIPMQCQVEQLLLIKKTFIPLSPTRLFK